MRILISDAYSPTNVGDGELVRLSIESVRSRYGVLPVVLCTDKAGFEADPEFSGTEFCFKPLSRVRWRTFDAAGRLSMLFRDVSGILLALVTSILPIPTSTRKSLLRACSRTLRTAWLSEIVRADRVVGVGGGYLGDKYLRESLITLALYRVAIGLKIDVETMPISISSAKRTSLSLALRFFGRGVRWRSREMTTQNILLGLGLHSDCVPDLAWLNVSVDRTDPQRITALVVAPLGSDFYGNDRPKEPKIWPHMRDYVSTLDPGARVSLIAMHYWDNRLQDGRDDQECERVAELIRGVNPQLKVSIHKLRKYSEVLTHMSGARFAVCERLHAALAGLAVGTQTKVVGYEPKHRGVLELAGLHTLVDESINSIQTRITSEFIAEKGAEQAVLTRQSVMEA
ncbi:polysaccharide pyruvyl transferase family protein [Arthrobacter sp. NyZ413]|uniref:polysaccharide pyruvyl transferase family protein n=1 Tax=Arthrobacter sp. NyZ413 TaxID=3144669 RepID=UPI003BF87DF2